MLNHVLLHQVIGQEAIAQLELTGEGDPDVIVGCVGGGSNFAGLTFPWMRRKLHGDLPGTRFVAAEPAACPTLTRGTFAYDFGDTVGMTPLMPMYTLGTTSCRRPCTPVACAITAGRRCSVPSCTRGRSRLAPTSRTRRSRRPCASPASRGSSRRPSAHAIRAVEEEARAAAEAGEGRVILFGLCGHGHFDLAADDAYLAGTLEDPELSASDMDAALARLPEAPALA